MKPIALITAAAARELDEDLPPLVAALSEAGLAHEIVCWDDARVDWKKYGIALLRSTWDYVPRLDEFLTWAEQVSTQTRLLNPVELIRWNTDKVYLADLASKGIAIVPSSFVAPGVDAVQAIEDFLGEADADSDHAFAEFVVKPSVGAGSRDAARYHRDDRALAVTHLQRLLEQGRRVLLQPYLDRVDADGETALVYLDGMFSHAIRKGPLLARAAQPTKALFAAEDISARLPGADQIALGDAVVAAISKDPRFSALMPLLYMRIDLLRRADGSACVLELETTEPSLFFDHAQGSAARLAKALARRL
jgi:hypothetical protein